jgi:hypothetical protein
MVDFAVRLIEEVEPTIPAVALLSGEEPAQGPPPGQRMVLLQASRPVQQVAVIRTHGAPDQDVSSNRNGGMLGQLDILSRCKAPVVPLIVRQYRRTRQVADFRG